MGICASALEWRRPQRGNGFAVFAKVCILFSFYIPIKLLIAIVKIVLCSGWFEKLRNFQKKVNNVYSP